MGVQGLTTLLESGGRPHFVSLSDGEASGRPRSLLLIDASAVEYYILRKIGGVALWPSAAFHEAVYYEACRLLGGLQRTGLKCVLIADTATEQGHEATYTSRRRGAFIPPTISLVFFQAVRELGLEVERSIHSADPLLLSWAVRNNESLFALLTDDSDFYVYGVPRIAHTYDVVIDAHSVSLTIWRTEELWSAWQVTAAGPGFAFMPPLLQRAQVAGILGNDRCKSLRHQLQHRRTTSASAGTRRSAQPISPSFAAREIIKRKGPVGPLTLEFFRNEPLSLRRFADADLAEFNGVVQSYLDEHKAAQNGSAATQLVLTEEALPWIDPVVAGRLAAPAPVPGFLLALASRGFASLALPAAIWQPLQSLRRQVAQSLLGDRAPGPSYEYESDAHALQVLVSAGAAQQPAAAASAANGGAAAAAALLRKHWLVPSRDLPEVPVVGDLTAAPPAEPFQRQATPAETAKQLQEAYPDVPYPLLQLYALSLHFVDPDPAAWDEQAVRDALLPNVPLRFGAVQAMAAGADGAEEEAAEAAGAGVPLAAVIDVGSGLSAEDWNDIDDKDVVAKVRAGPGYSLMKRIQPWNLDLASRRGGGGPAVRSSKQFQLAREAVAAGPDSDEWKRAQREWAKAKPQERQLALSDLWSSANRWVSSAAGPMRHHHQQELLDLVDEHLRLVSPDRPRRPLHVILSTPTGSGKTFTAVMMQLHVLRGSGAAAAAGGVGATRTTGGRAAAVAESAAVVEDRPGHPRAVLVYSVPTKQVLKRVGQECEAHGVVYWTAARDGDLYQVRRPYSIRTKRGKKGGGGTGSMARQLQEAAAQGATFEDLGGGKPDVIIADIHATAALVRSAREASPDDFYHWSNVVLYLDEPNMGIHLDREVRSVVRSIMAAAPLTTILASATLPAWDDLPAWWKGSGAQKARHAVITQEPYELPMAKLAVLDEVSGQLVPVSPLDLFDDAAELAATLERSPRARVLLLRHFTADQANQLMGLQADGSAAGVVKGAAEAENGGNGETKGDAAANGGGEEEGPAEDNTWKVLEQDVRGLRSELLEPEVVALAEQPERFAALKEGWRQRAEKADSMVDVLSKQGVTLVATLEPRQLALRLAGKAANEDKWAQEARAMRARVRAAAAEKRAADKARDRAAKRGDEDGGRAGGRDDGLSGAGRLALRPGLVVWADEADDIRDDNTLVMLSKGVAYTATANVEPLVKRLYQQALLYVPERENARPPLHTLVVDYSAVYGTDCPAVDTIVLCPDLAAVLSWEDHQQFMGRLRRDGTAIYPSLDLLRRAVLGGGRDQWREREALRASEQCRRVEEVLAPHLANAAAAAAGDTTKAAVKELLQLVRPAAFSRSDVGCVVLAAALRDLVAPQARLAGDAEAETTAAAATLLATDQQLLDAALKRLRQWGSLRPLEVLEALRLDRPAEQKRLVGVLEELCLAEPAPAGAADAAAAAKVSSTRRFLPCAARLLQDLGNEDLLEAEGLTLWCEEEAKRVAAEGAAGVRGAEGVAAAERAKAFRKAVVKVRDWLVEQEEEEDEEDEE